MPAAVRVSAGPVTGILATLADLVIAEPLIFVLAPAGALPQGATSLEALIQAQAAGPSSGFALRIFSAGSSTNTDLTLLPWDGRLTGDQRRSSDGSQLLCDALVVDIDPDQHWLGVYASDASDPERFHSLDQVPLSELSNASCWFYPTHDGRFLSWERHLQLSLQPGAIAPGPEGFNPLPYARSRLTVLWSLLADNSRLTCVGLTYGGQRLDWPLHSPTPAPIATWSAFQIDSSADPSLVVAESRQVGVADVAG